MRMGIQFQFTVTTIGEGEEKGNSLMIRNLGLLSLFGGGSSDDQCLSLGFILFCSVPFRAAQHS